MAIIQTNQINEYLEKALSLSDDKVRTIRAINVLKDGMKGFLAELDLPFDWI